MKKLFVFVLLLAVIGGAYYEFGPNRTPQLSEKALTFANVQLGTMRDVVSATGLVEPREIVFISSEIPGTVTKLLARVNDTVAEGAELAQLDDRKIVLKREEARNGVQLATAAYAEAQAKLVQAKASRDAADLGLKYQQDLASKGGFRSDREQAEAMLRAASAGVEAADAGVGAAQAKIEAARTQFQDAELAQRLMLLKAPESQLQRLPAVASVGLIPTTLKEPEPRRREFFILERKVQEGQMVGPQSGPLFILASALDRIEIHAQVAEGDVNKVHKGLPATFTVTSFLDEELEFRGAVQEIRPLANNVKGGVYYDTIIQVENRKDASTGDWLLRPGMTASVDIVRREHKMVWKIPTAALNFQLDEAYQSPSIRAPIASWKHRSNSADWLPLWLWDATLNEARPRFVRVGGQRNGEPGLKDSEGIEVLEWEAGQEPTAPLRVIITAPSAHPPGLFDQPAPIKVS